MRDELGLKAGEELIVESRGHEIVIRKPVDIFNYTPPRARRDVALTDAETIQVAHEDRARAKSGRKPAA